MFPNEDSGDVDVERDGMQTDVSDFSSVDELDGSLGTNHMDEKLMHNVLEGDKQTIDEGKLIQESLNQGMGAFNPSMMMEQLVKNFSMAKQIYGESLLRQVCGYDTDYLERNIGIPEFQKELEGQMKKKMEQMQRSKAVDKEGIITENGIELASVILYVQELDHLVPKGISGERLHKKHFIYGDRMDARRYKKGDRYKDIAIKRSVKSAIRRGHAEIEVGDLEVFERQSKGEVYLVYGLDASGSMKGEKIGVCKKAGVSLAFKAIQNKDKVGLLVFGSEVEDIVEPTRNFGSLLNAITRVKARSETDIAGTIRRAVEMFPGQDVTRHLLLLTDALPTKGEDPEKETLEAASEASSLGISISIVGINLDDKGVALAEKVVSVGSGRLYTVRDVEEVGRLVLEDYYRVA